MSQMHVVHISDAARNPLFTVLFKRRTEVGEVVRGLEKDRRTFVVLKVKMSSTQITGALEQIGRQTLPQHGHGTNAEGYVNRQEIKACGIRPGLPVKQIADVLLGIFKAQTFSEFRLKESVHCSRPITRVYSANSALLARTCVHAAHVDPSICGMVLCASCSPLLCSTSPGVPFFCCYQNS